MPRKFRPLDRDGGRLVRDASLIVIASEDSYAAKDYFARFKTNRVQFTVLPTIDGKSAPVHVKERLEKFTLDYTLEDNDTLWICIDRNGWPEDELKSIFGDCIKKNFKIAISNPCWELWLLLHFEGLSADWTLTACQAVCERLKTKIGSGTGKRLCRTLTITEEQVRDAITRAKAIDLNEHDLVPQVPTTRVYKILEELLAKERIQFVEAPTRS